jgi:glycosyltransferase involved in cell wall biosynthesis
MRIVIASERFSEGMGYSENVWPRALAARGHDVYVVTSTMQVYGDADFYDAVYRRFLGPRHAEPGIKKIDGVTVIRLPVFCWWKRFRLTKGGIRQVLKLKPDIVQTFDPRSMQTLLLSFHARRCGFKLFTSEHSVASIYPAYHSLDEWPLHQRLYLRFTETFIGWLACRRAERCYASTSDAEEIAVRFHGLRPEQMRRMSLGIDTALLHPVRTEADRQERLAHRAQLGFAVDDIICIYTGRFTEAKNPLCLARAVEILRGRGLAFRAIFLGDGEQSKKIASTKGCQVQSFVPYPELGRFYRAVDIGVWPCQESISMMDAASAGLPIIVGDKTKAVERYEGNGLTYSENDPQSLAERLCSLEDASLRNLLGMKGAEKMRASFSVDRVIEILLGDYEAALKQ